MATALTRLTFVVTKEMEPLLANAKKNQFYDRTQSDMIRELVLLILYDTEIAPTHRR